MNSKTKRLACHSSNITQIRKTCFVQTRIALYLSGMTSFKRSLHLDIINKIQTDQVHYYCHIQFCSFHNQTLNTVEIKHELVDLNGIIYLCHTISYHSVILKHLHTFFASLCIVDHYIESDQQSNGSMRSNLHSECHTKHHSS